MVPVLQESAKMGSRVVEAATRRCMRSDRWDKGQDRQRRTLTRSVSNLRRKPEMHFQCSAQKTSELDVRGNVLKHILRDHFGFWGISGLARRESLEKFDFESRLICEADTDLV